MATAPTASSHQPLVAASTSPATAATPKQPNAAVLTAGGEAAPEPDQPQRADPVGIGAADAVGVVVGVVDAHLQRQRDQQRQQRLAHDHGVGEGGGTGARDDRRHGRGQGARARPLDPLRQRRHDAGVSQAAPSLAVVPSLPHQLSRPLSGTPAQVWAALREWWADPVAPVVVRTSGSTGAPKDVVLSAAALTASARATLARLGGPGQWLLALPATNVAGLQVLVRSLLAGTEPVLAGDDLAGAARDAGLGTGRERAYTALVPTQLHRLDRAGDMAALARFDAVLLGGAPAPPALLERARGAGVRVVTTYGTSETCGGCVYDGVALDGVAVRVDGDGAVQVAGPVLFDGYAGDPEATAAVLRDGWFRTGDLGRLDHDGRLEVLGRAEDVVHSGGVSVHLAAVERVVRSHPGVVDAAVTALDDDEWGSRVVAVVVPGTDSLSPWPSCATTSRRRCRVPGRPAPCTWWTRSRCCRPARSTGWPYVISRRLPGGKGDAGTD